MHTVPVASMLEMINCNKGCRDFHGSVRSVIPGEGGGGVTGGCEGHYILTQYLQQTP